MACYVIAKSLPASDFEAKILMRVCSETRVAKHCRGSPIGFSGFYSQIRERFGIKSMRGRWDAKNSPRDYGIARNLRSGLRDWRTLLGTLTVRNRLPRLSLTKVRNEQDFCQISSNYNEHFVIYCRLFTLPIKVKKTKAMSTSFTGSSPTRPLWGEPSLIFEI